MAVTRKVAIPGNVTYTYRDFFGGPVGGVVGQPPWNDDADTSYVDLYTSSHPDAAFADTADGFVAATDLSHLPSDRTKVTVFARVRCQVLTSTGVEAPMRVSLWYSAANMITTLDGATTPGSSIGWHDIGPFPFATQSDYDAFVSYTESGGLRVRVNPVPLRLASGGWLYPGYRVTEVHLTVKSPGGEAPMCRKFPVEPASRHFPPGKSQQRSGRRFGHY